MPHQSLSCLLTLKPQSLSFEVLPDQFNTIENVMMSICAPHIDSLIVYEHLVEVEGRDPNIGGFKTSNHVDRDQAPPTSSQTWVHAIVERY